MEGPDGPEESQTCWKALAQEIGSQNGVAGQAGVMGPWSGAEESGCSGALAGVQSVKTVPAENGP